jgi:hypothetical protein
VTVSLVYSEIGGITVASQASDEQSVRRDLKKIDDRYMLDCVPTSAGMCWIVLCRVGSEQPPLVVCNWLDEQGTPLPLSSGLVEKVRRLRVDGRFVQVDPETENQRLRQRNQEAFEDEIDEAVRYRLKHKGQWRYFFGEARLNPLAVRAARMKAGR